MLSSTIKHSIPAAGTSYSAFLLINAKDLYSMRLMSSVNKLLLFTNRPLRRIVAGHIAEGDGCPCIMIKAYDQGSSPSAQLRGSTKQSKEQLRCSDSKLVIKM